MDDLLSLFRSPSSSTQNRQQPSQTLLLRPSPYDPNHTVIHPLNTPVDTTPLFTLITSKINKPNLLLFRGAPHPVNLIGDAVFHSFSSRVEGRLRGREVKMEMVMGGLSRDWLVEWEGMVIEKRKGKGNMKWCVSKVTGSSLTLKDEKGGVVAGLKAAGGFLGMGGEGKLEILGEVDSDGRFLEFVVLSGMAARGVMSEQEEVAGEIVSAVAGF